MTEDEEQKLSESFAQAAQTSRGFAPEEMVVCEACRRANPPTRAGCLYCGARLPVSVAGAALRRPVLKSLEEWERGVNVVLLPSRASMLKEPLTGEALAGASALLRLEEERVREMSAAGVALPVARAASKEEAALVADRLRALGFAVEVFDDEELSPSSLPTRRARALELGVEALTLRASAESEAERVAWSDVLLFVAGRVFERRVEVAEQRERLGAQSEIVEAREFVSDEAVLDIYAARGAGWRVAADGFDYSCLGARKGLLVAQNFETLKQALRERATEADFDEDYARVRHLLQAAWPPAERTEAQGVRRGRGHRLNTQAATVVTNEAQFTRYSRLRRRLALREHTTQD